MTVILGGKKKDPYSPREWIKHSCFCCVLHVGNDRNMYQLNTISEKDHQWIGKFSWIHITLYVMTRNLAGQISRDLHSDCFAVVLTAGFYCDSWAHNVRKVRVVKYIVFYGQIKVSSSSSSFKFIKKNWENTKYDVPLLAVSYSYSRRAVAWH